MISRLHTSHTPDSYFLRSCSCPFSSSNYIRLLTLFRSRCRNYPCLELPCDRTDIAPYNTSFSGNRGFRNLSVLTPSAPQIKEYSSRESLLSPFKAKLSFDGSILVFLLRKACDIPFSFKYSLISKFSFNLSPPIPLILESDNNIIQVYWIVNRFSKKISRFLEFFIYKI